MTVELQPRHRSKAKRLAPAEQNVYGPQHAVKEASSEELHVLGKELLLRS
jgi:hypothetical protein